MLGYLSDLRRFCIGMAVLLAVAAVCPADDGNKPSAAQEPPRGSGSTGGKAEARRLLLRPRARPWEQAPAGVEESIQRAIKYLWSKQDGDGTWAGRHAKRYPTGETALAAYALLASGVNPQDKKMQKALTWLSKNDSSRTYSLGIRCCVWHLANKKTRGKYFAQLKKDASLLYRSHNSGHYHYDSKGKPQKSWCNSNSQYGLLGVWAAAANGGIAIPADYWQAVAKHWTNTQGTGGGWAYSKTPEGDAWRFTMMTAGIASLYICYDYSGLADKSPAVVPPPISKGFRLLDKHFKVKQSGWQYYLLYGVARVGQASGRKYIGAKDWYKDGALLLLEKQRDDGGWKQVPETAFALLFLVHGRRSVLFNKLQHDGDWNRRPREVAGLTRALDHVFKSEIDWQVVDFGMLMTAWCDGPILYITGTQDPKLTRWQLEKIRTYVQQGGTIFTVVQKGGKQFNSAMQDAYKKLFPKHKLTAAAPSHEVYSNCFNLGKWTGIKILSNGARPVVIHTDVDLAAGWPSAGVRPPIKNLMVQIAANVAKYVTKAETLPLGPAAGYQQIKTFKRGNFEIAIGQTRPQVKTAMAGGRQKFHKIYDFRKVDKDMYARDVWELSYGPQVPGMGRVDLLRLTFKHGQLVKLEVKSYLCP